MKETEGRKGVKWRKDDEGQLLLQILQILVYSKQVQLNHRPVKCCCGKDFRIKLITAHWVFGGRELSAGWEGRWVGGEGGCNAVGRRRKVALLATLLVCPCNCDCVCIWLWMSSRCGYVGQVCICILPPCSSPLPLPLHLYHLSAAEAINNKTTLF